MPDLGVSDRRSGPPATARAGAGWRLAAVFAIQLGFLGAILLLSACYTAAGKLTALDVVALPDEWIELKAKIEHDGPGFLNRDISGVEVLFGRGAAGAAANPAAGEAPSAGETILGAARSDGEGLARLSVRAPAEPGDHAFWVRLKDPRRIRLPEPETPFVVSVIAPAQPILITDIDDTIAETRIRPILADRPEEVPVVAGAAQVLVEAARKYRIVYLTARSTYLARRTRRWLEAKGFPAGAVILRDLWAEWRSLNLTEEEYKDRVCQFLKAKKGFTEIRFGIGNRMEDGEAYARNGIRAIVLGGDPKKVKASHRDRLQTAETWEEIRKLILP